MTDSELLSYARRLTLKWGEDKNAPKEVRFWAVYLEVPGAIAFGATEDQAKQELADTIVPFLKLRLEHGGTLPSSLRESPVTSGTFTTTTRITFDGITVGEDAAFAGGLASREGTTELRDPVEHLRVPEEVAA